MAFRISPAASCSRIIAAIGLPTLSKRRKRRGTIPDHGSFQLHDIWKENALLFHHVRFELGPKNLKLGPNLRKFWMIRAMDGTDLFEQGCKAFQFATREDVVLLNDETGEFRKWQRSENQRLETCPLPVRS